MPDLGAQRDIVADRQAARETDLGREQAVPADGHIVADLDLIVDFGALADHGIAQAAAVDGGAGADLDIVLDQHAAGLRHLQMAFGAEEDEAVAVLPDAAAGMDQDVVADQRKLDGGTGADIAVAADPHVGPDHRAGADHGARADLDPGADHRQRVDDNAVFQMRRGVDDGRRRDAVIVEPGLRPERVAMPLAGDLHEGAERLGGAQDRDMGGYPGFEARADQAGAGPGRGELVGVFEIVEKRQMHGPGFVERSQPPDGAAALRGISQYRLCQRGDISQRRRRRLLEEVRLRHSTRRSPAAVHTRAPVALERCSAAKPELLHAVELTLGDRNRIVEAQRTERRGPDQADTDRGADHIAVVILQSEAGARVGAACVAASA